MSEYGYTTLTVQPEVAEEVRRRRDETDGIRDTTEALAELLDEAAVE